MNNETIDNSYYVCVFLFFLCFSVRLENDIAERKEEDIEKWMNGEDNGNEV